MDPLKATINTFDKYAVEYEDKYMNYGPYVDTYGPLSDLLSADACILDAACGPGNIAKFLLQEFPDRTLHGIDLSAKMVARARLNNPAATFDVMDCRQISSLTQMFDSIVAGFCLPYLSREDVSTFISDARALLNADGILYISFMEGDYAASGLQTRNNIDWVCTYYHDTDLLVDNLNKAGFGIIDIVRKMFARDNEPDATDVFIYARVSR